MSISWQQYPVVVFIDSNIALECSALDGLPWKEISATGPILVLVVPMVMKEVDSMKNHARLGDHARRFNRTLRPLFQGEATVLVRESPAPRVEIALADCKRVDWEQYPELDRDEPDACVVAQALSAQGPSPESCVLVSQDIRPLQLARPHGLKLHQVSETWLRPKEVSEADKRAAKLQRELNEMKAREPQLSLHLSTTQPSVDVHRIRTLTNEERLAIQNAIVARGPRLEPSGLSSIIGHYEDYDVTWEQRYTRWKYKKVPDFVRNYERKIELNYGQLEIRFQIKNTGMVPAESLLIRLTATGGWFNERWVVASPSGPAAPMPEQRSLMGIQMQRTWHDSIRSMAQPRKHEFVVLDDPKRSSEIQISCADFRHGLGYEYAVIGWADPFANDFRVDAVVTAANLYGEAKTSIVVARNVKYSSVEDLIDMSTMRFKQPTDVDGHVDDAIGKSNFKAFELDES